MIGAVPSHCIKVAGRNSDILVGWACTRNRRIASPRSFRFASAISQTPRGNACVTNSNVSSQKRKRQVGSYVLVTHLSKRRYIHDPYPRSTHLLVVSSQRRPQYRVLHSW